ncbi:MAG: hypothetical protein P1U87_00830 [Verrucomicrobiales bacterium]|nr:hypothetical protein [Verrucomicrobiales bacterium]
MRKDLVNWFITNRKRAHLRGISYLFGNHRSESRSIGDAPATQLPVFAVTLLALYLIGNLSAEPPRRCLLASRCFQCHGTNGQAVGGFESISEKSAHEMFEELREMSQRRPEDIMNLQASAYTGEQLRQISDYLATLPRGSDDDDNDDANNRNDVVDAAKAAWERRLTRKRAGHRRNRRRTESRVGGEARQNG